jgi:Flp pilus assembly protein TadG
MPILRAISNLWRDDRGNALFIAAASMPLLIGAAGMAVDTVHISLSKRQLQRAADSAAIAGASGIAQNRTPGPSVTRDLQINNDIPLLAGSPQVGAPTSGPFANNNQAVRVRLSASRSLSFFGVFGHPSQSIIVEATAAVIRDGQFCMQATEDGNVPGITFGGNTTVNVGCGIATNSRSATAIVADGSASVTASPLIAVGGVPASGAYASGTTLMPNSARQVDPFAHLPLPAPTDCQNQLSVNPNQTRNIGPAIPGGSICFKGMDVKGTLNLAPGTYFIDGSTRNGLSFGAQSVINGTGVTFVLTSTTAATDPSSVATTVHGDINGKATVNLVAPSSGPYAGVLFYEDPRAPLGRITNFSGSSTSVIEGAFYFPRGYLNYSGTTGMTTRCMQLVARRLNFTGNSRIENQCNTPGGAQAIRGTYVRLVG